MKIWVLIPGGGFPAQGESSASAQWPSLITGRAHERVACCAPQASSAPQAMPSLEASSTEWRIPLSGHQINTCCHGYGD